MVVLEGGGMVLCGWDGQADHLAVVPEGQVMGRYRLGNRMGRLVVVPVGQTASHLLLAHMATATLVRRIHSQPQGHLSVDSQFYSGISETP